MRIHSLLRRLLAPYLIFLASLLATTTLAQQQASIAVLPDIHRDYTRFLAERDVREVTYYGGDYARRDVIELVLMLQALALGEFEHPIVFADEENYFRSIRNVIDGKTLSIGGTIWYQDLIGQQEQLHISAPIVKEGQFVVGLYTSPNNQRALKSKTLTQLNQLKVATSRQWKPDLDTLQQLGFDKIMYTPNWINIARMINAGRVDFTLSPVANNPGKEILVDNIKLVSIEGIKIAISGSRHWPVSKKHPLAAEFYRALSLGVEQLQRTGTIERAYRECGFFHPELESWVLLNPPIE